VRRRPAGTCTGAHSSACRLLLLLALLALAVAPVAAAEEPGAEHAAAAAHASEGGHATADHASEAEHGNGHADTWLGLPRPVFLTLNLAIFLGALGWFAAPVIVRFLDDKRQEIRHALVEAERQRAEATAMESRLAAQIQELRQEVEEIATRAEREGERERQEILAEAERERARLQAAARTEIEQGLLRARQELTAHAARLASQLAGERIAAGLTREDRKRLFRDNLARLESHREGTETKSLRR
jgi:F-type H+-transporting ATPase subunit b